MKEKDNKVIKLIVLILIMVMLIVLAVVGIKLVLADKDETTKIKEESEKQEIVTGETKEGITATNIEEDASYIGKYVNYGGEKTFKGVKWRIFNAENGQIQLIADNYIKSNIMPAAPNILKEGTVSSASPESPYYVLEYEVGTMGDSSRDSLLNYINMTSNWIDFVAVEGAIVTGGPTIEQFINSYNRTHEASLESDVKEIYIAQSEVMEDGVRGYYVGTVENPTESSIYGLNTTEMGNLYVLDNTNCEAYWLGSASASDSSYVVSVSYEGVVLGHSCTLLNNLSIDLGIGLRPLVTLPSGITLLEQENGTYNIQKDNLKEKETITSTDIEADANYIGKYVNYGGEEIFKGVKWRIFNAENGQIQLIADNYIDANVMPTAQNILKGPTALGASNYEVTAENERKILLNYINTMSNWEDFVAVEGATVTGGPTIEQFINSYNRTHGANSKIYIAQSEKMKDGLKGYYIGTVENPKTHSIDSTISTNLYVIANSNIYAYWLGSPSASYSSCVVVVTRTGGVDYDGYHIARNGLRPLVTLPTGITLVEQENGTYNIQGGKR